MLKNIDMNIDNHPIVKTKIPFMVKRIFSKAELPKDEAEMIEFSQLIAKMVIKEIEPINKN